MLFTYSFLVWDQGSLVGLWMEAGSIGLVIKRSQVQILVRHYWHNNLSQVVHTLVPLSPSSISW